MPILQPIGEHLSVTHGHFQVYIKTETNTKQTDKSTNRQLISTDT
jgi:hypothetical protein